MRGLLLLGKQAKPYLLPHQSFIKVTKYTKVELQSSSIVLGRLLHLVLQGKLKVAPIIEAYWSKTPNYAQDLLARKFEVCVTVKPY